MVTDQDEKEVTPEEAIVKLWEMGNLEYKLKGNQIRVKKAFQEAPDDQESHTVLCSRRFGKSYILCSWGIEVCIKTPNALVKYACPKKGQAEEIVNDIIPNFILDDCPDHMRPQWKESKKCFLFPNGSRLMIAGTDQDKGKALRGGRANLAIVDEAQDHKYLTYVVDSVLSPTLDTTGGKIILAGTPNPEEPNHPFHIDYIQPLASQGKLIKFTVYESPLYDEQGQTFINRLEKRYASRGGLNSAAFKCEYLCEIAIDEDSFVIPEFVSDSTQEKLVSDVPRPEYYDWYVSMDIGGRHLTAAIFGYFDFVNNKVIIEDEFICPEKPTTQQIVDGLNGKERDLRFRGDPWMRVCDNNNLILVNDLNMSHELNFTTTAKDDKMAQINKLRMMISSGEVLISPKCEHLIYHLTNAKWQDSRNYKKGFAELKDSPDGKLRGGHADLVDCLIYFIRNVNYHKSPYPAGYGQLKGPNVWGSDRGIAGGFKDLMKKAMNIKK